MKEKWQEKYRSCTRKANVSRDVLIGFNANIDVVYKVRELDLDLEVEAQELEKVSSLKDLKFCLKYCIKNGENREVELKELKHNFRGGKEHIGGQAGIMTNYLSGIGNGVIFYTPFLSEKLAELVNENVLYPVVEGEFTLKNVRDAPNTDRTKKNLIFEYSADKTGRLIASRKMKGFGPYFRKGVEDNFELIQENVDRIILSGFHDVEGNIEAKLEKAKKQIKKLYKPVHLEYVHRNKDLAQKIGEKIIPYVESIGLDEDELKLLTRSLDLDLNLEDGFTLGEAFNACRKIIEKFELKRCHVHTYRFHLTVTSDDYPISKNNIRDGMLFGELSAIKFAETGQMPTKEDLEKFDMENKHIQELDDLEDFQDFFELPSFLETGTANIEGYKVVAIPPIIHEDPEKLVGLGDIISSGSFIGEIN